MHGISNHGNVSNPSEIKLKEHLTFTKKSSTNYNNDFLYNIITSQYRSSDEEDICEHFANIRINYSNCLCFIYDKISITVVIIIPIL